MKKNISTLVILLAVSLSSFGQGIDFKKLDWDANLKSAATNNQLVYIDFYTTWCGPCTYMAKKYFPTKEAGDFYNKNFLCLKLDAEKEGAELAKQYKVAGYPTNIFVNPKNKEIVYKTVGAPSQLAAFIENGKVAIEEFKDPLSLEQYADKMDKGDSSKAFTMKYLKKLTRMDKPNQWPLDVYSHLYFKKNIDSVECRFMDAYMKDINNNTFEIFKKNKKAYNKHVEQSGNSHNWEKNLASKIYATNRMAANNNNGPLFRKCVNLAKELLPKDDQIRTIHYLGSVFYKNNDSNMHRKNEYEYAEALTNAKGDYFKTKNAEALASILRQIDWQSKEWTPKQLSKLDSLKDAYSKNKEFSMRETRMAAEHLNSQAWHVFENDGDHWPEALPWARAGYRLAKESDSESTAAIADTYANLLFVNGKKKEAIKVQKEAIKIKKKAGQDVSGYQETLKKFTGE